LALALKETLGRKIRRKLILYLTTKKQQNSVLKVKAEIILARAQTLSVELHFTIEVWTKENRSRLSTDKVKTFTPNKDHLGFMTIFTELMRENGENH